MTDMCDPTSVFFDRIAEVVDPEWAEHLRSLPRAKWRDALNDLAGSIAHDAEVDGDESILAESRAIAQISADMRSAGL